MQQWYSGKLNYELRVAHSNNRKPFARAEKAYESLKEHFTYFQQSGMECFARPEQKLFRNSCLKLLCGRGEAVLESFRPKGADFDVALLALDLEGSSGDMTSINQCGMAYLSATDKSVATTKSPKKQCHRNLLSGEAKLSSPTMFR